MPVSLTVRNSNQPTQLNVPVVLPLLALDALAGGPRDGDGAAVHLVVLQALHALVRVLAPVHHDKGAPPGRNQVDTDNVAVLAERIGQLLLLDQLGQVAHPQRRAAHCRKDDDK